jgi:hypothetical protein
MRVERNPDKNLSVRRLEFMPRNTSTKIAVQEFHPWPSRMEMEGTSEELL